jgi:universal stress protein A
MAEQVGGGHGTVRMKSTTFMKPAVAKKSRADAIQALHPNFQRILVAVDFSEESRSALACAAEMAGKFGASLTLVHVVEPHFGPPDTDVPPLTGAQSDAEEFAEAKLELSDLAEQMLGQCRVVETVVRGGLAFFEITEAAKALGADLIVVGTHGYTGLKRALLGSTAEKVVRHSPCPVLVARANYGEIMI